MRDWVSSARWRIDEGGERGRECRGGRWGDASGQGDWRASEKNNEATGERGGRIIGEKKRNNEKRKMKRRVDVKKDKDEHKKKKN